MKIVHLIDSLLIDIFPGLEGKLDKPELIKQYFVDFYLSFGMQANVSVSEHLIEIEVDDSDAKEYKQLIKLCDQGSFKKALKLVNTLIIENPESSDLFRIKGQIYFELNDKDEALTCFTEALKRDTANTAALVMIGNIFYHHFKNNDLAAKYYKKAISHDKNHFVALTNYASLVLNKGNVEEGKVLLNCALEANPKHPNALLALAMVHKNEGEFLKAFNLATNAMRHLSSNDPMMTFLNSFLFSTAEAYVQNVNPEQLFNKYLNELSQRSKTPIKLQLDNTITVEAKLEIAENYNRDYNLVKYKTLTNAFAHLVMHELGHLELILDARAESKNCLFITSSKNEDGFLKQNQAHLNKLKKIYADRAKDFLLSLFSGINLQMMNAPMDLFIEHYLYHKFEDLRPIQFLSVHKILQDSIAPSKDKQLLQKIPESIKATNFTLSMVAAMQFRDLFGLDLLSDFQVSKNYRSRAEALYEEFKEIREDRQPGEEYELINDWAEGFGIRSWFDLQEENAYRYGSKSEKQQHSKVEDSIKESLPEVTRYCLDALLYFNGMDKTQIQNVTFEIAILGESGIDPKNKEKKTKLNSVPMKEFLNLEMLAWMHTGFSLIDKSLPTGLDFDKELEEAQNLLK